MNPVAVSRYCYIEAKNFEEASQRAVWVAQAERCEVKHVSECAPPETEEETTDEGLDDILKAN